MEQKTFDLFSELTKTEKDQAKVTGIISAAIFNKRNELKMSQKKFAEFMNVSQGMVSKWESCEYNFSIEKLVEVFNELDIDFNISVNKKGIKSKNQNSWISTLVNIQDSWEQHGKYSEIQLKAG